jgi:hypothetical protein
MTMTDPLLVEVLSGYTPEDKQADFVIREAFPTDDRAVVTFEKDQGEGTVEQIWVQVDGQWQLDACANWVDPLGAGVALVGDMSEEGLAARVRSIADAVETGDVGIYQWLSLRCRLGLTEVMGDYGLILLYPGYGADLVDLTSVVVGEVDGQAGLTSAITEWDLLTPSGGGARWTFEDGDWLYDGCPTDEEVTTRDEERLEAVLNVHAALVDLEIPGMASTGFYDTDVNGPIERVYSFELISQTPAWWEIQAEFIERRWPKILEDAGYDVLEARGQYVRAVHRDDPMAEVGVRLESTYLDSEHERHSFWLTLRYR